MSHRLRSLVQPLALEAWRRWERAGEIVPGTRAARRFGSFGDGSVVGFPPATLLNEHVIHLGRDVQIGRQVTLSAGYAAGQTVGLAPRTLVIGDRCMIGARSTLTAHDSVEIGDDVFLGQGVFVTDASHGYLDPHVPVGAQFGEHDPVRIGPGCWLGHAVTVLPGTRLGRNVVVAAGAVVRGEVEDHAVVAGNPARVVRRLEPDVGWRSGSSIGSGSDDVRAPRPFDPTRPPSRRRGAG